MNNVVGIFNVSKNLQATFIVSLPDLGHAELARAAIEKPRAKPLFQ